MKGMVMFSMNSIKHFKNLMSILMLYAANIIVPEKAVTVKATTVSTKLRITGKNLLRRPTAEKM